VVAILRAARTPKGTEVRTVIKHVTKRLRTHWPNTRIVWRGDSHYGRVEATLERPPPGAVCHEGPVNMEGREHRIAAGFAIFDNDPLADRRPRT
jgi:hypothetical protein